MQTAPDPSATRRNRLQWYALTCGIVLFGVLLVYAYASESDRVLATERDRLRVQVDVIADDMERNLEATNMALEGVLKDHLAEGVPAPAGQAAVSRRLRALVAAMAGVRGMGVYRSDGVMAASHRAELVGMDFSHRAYFTVVRNRPDPTRLYVSAPFNSVDNDVVATVGRMVPGPAGSFSGVVLATLDPKYFLSMLRPALYAPDVIAQVVHADGQPILRLPPVKVPEGPVPAGTFVADQRAAPGTRVETGMAGPTGPRVVAWRAVQPERLHMDKALVAVVSRDMEALLQPVKRQWLAYSLFYAVAAIVLGSGLFMLQRRAANVEALKGERERTRLDAAERVQLALRGANLGLFEMHLPTGGWMVDEAACANLGLKVEDVSGSVELWRARMHPQDAIASREAFEACIIGTRQFYDFSYRIRHRDGHWVWLLARAQAVERDAQGRAIRIMGTVMDVSQSKAAETAIVTARNELQTVFDSMTEAVLVFDRHRKLVRMNRAGHTMHGLFEPSTPVEEVRSNIEVLLPSGEPLPRDDWPNARALRGEYVRDFELEVRRRDTGRSVFVESTTAPILDDAGEVQLVIHTHHNVTERHTTLALRQSEARFRTLIEDAPLAITMLRDGHIVYANPRYRVLYGYAPEEDLTGMAWNAMLGPESRLALAAQHALIGADSPIEQSFEAVGWSKAGAPVPVHITTARVALADGAVTLIFAQDIAAQKQAEAAMLQARDAAESANRSKAEFLANMSHEIRSPLNVILGLAYLLERARLGRDAHDMVHKIRASGRNLLGIINDILDVSKIEAGRMDLENAPFRLSDVIDNVAGTMGIAAGDKHIELIVAPLPPGLGAFLGDALRLEQVLGNLAGNAVKFTSEGQVVLQVQVLGQEAPVPGAPGPARQQLRFSVRDTGIGIAPDMLSTVFTAFAQADSSTTRRFGGTGLGLTICRQLVTLMGGEIGVNSVLGQGSEFWFTLPLQPFTNGGFSSPEMVQIDALVADDSSIARDAVVATAQGLGWRVQAVASGEAALSQVLERLEGRLPDVVVLDWKMPGMDGMATARAIRQAAPADGCPIVIMATAYSLSALATEPGADMVDAILSKPVTTSALYNAVIEARRRRAAEVGLLRPASDGGSQELAGVRLLVVDDSEINCEVAKRILEEHGAAVQLAFDGAAALEWLLAHPAEVDVVLMDVQMPVMDGIEATRRLRGVPALRDLPVVALTAGAFKTQQEAAREAGMTEFVSKPFDVPVTVALIQRLKREREQRAAPQAAGQPAAAASAPASAQEYPGMDVVQGLRTWGKLDTYRDYLRRFVAAYANAGDAVAGLMAADDRKGAAALAHKLAGVAANMALPEVYRLAAEMERALVEERDATGALARLETALREACASIARFAPVVDA